MLSFPDFREKSIVFIGSDDVKKIQFLNENLVLKNEEEKVVTRISCHKIFCIFIIGELSITTVLIDRLLKYGISLILMHRNFNPYAVIGAETEGNFLLRAKQYKEINNLIIAKHIVDNKINNQLNLLKSFREKSDELKQSILQIKKIIEQIPSASEMQTLLGFEGSASKIFFSNYFRSIKWRSRMPRAKTDPTNTLMDIGYTYLFNFIDALLRLYGFDTYKGVYHQQFYLRKSLVCDLVEPFRCIIDRQILKSYNLGQVDEKDFLIKNGQYILQYQNSKKYTKIFFEAILENKEDIYKYIQQYYRCVMKGSQDYPQFIIS